MDVRTLSFGCEFELLGPETLVQNGSLRIGPYHHGIQVPFLPTGWTAERDGSIRSKPGFTPVEVVSPVLRGPEGLAQVAEVLRILTERGFRTAGVTAGCHIHVGFRRDWPADVLARLVSIVAYCEKGLYAITGTKSRERGIYCGGVRKYGDDKTAKPALDRNRYHLLNLTNLANGTRDTVEFRCFSGTANPTKACAWILACLGLVERALDGKRSPVWSPKPLKGGWKKAGEGASEAERLMGYLAWGAGYAKRRGGKSYWMENDVITQEQARTEFRRLAAKYDAQP